MEKEVARIRANELRNQIELAFLQKIKGKKLICYGASAAWSDAFQIIAVDDLVEFIVDGDERKWGEEYFGKEIKSPDIIKDIDRKEYAVIVLSGAFDEISEILNGMGLVKNVDYFNIYQYVHLHLESSFSSINKFLRFLETVPSEMKKVRARESSERIGILLNAEALNGGTTHIPYEVSLFLLLKWKGYNVKLIVDQLHWDGDFELYEGRCAFCDYIKGLVVEKLKELVPENDILYIEPVEGVKLSLEDEQECERIAAYSVNWSKWQNLWNSRFRTFEAVYNDFATIFKRNLAYIDAFFDKNHFDTINAATALHKMAGVYYYAAKKRNIRVSSQDGVMGSTSICANGPTSYCNDDISSFLKMLDDDPRNRQEIMNRAVMMWEKRKGAYITKDMSNDKYYKELKGGYNNICFQAPKTKIKHTYDVIIPLNVRNDGAALGTFTIFKDQKNWLEKTLEYLFQELNATVLIREHPTNSILPSFMANTELYSFCPKILEKYAGNKLLRYVRSEEKINLYQYIEQCKVVIPWTSTVGVEAGLMGKNVLVHTDVYYCNAAFASRVHTEEEYFEYLKKCIVDGDCLVKDVRRANEEALLYFYSTMNRLLITDFTLVNSGESEWKFNCFEELIKAEGVDEIIQIVGDNVPCIHLIEKQHIRLGLL